MSRFSWRAFASLLLSFSFPLALTTGLVLWLAHSPQTLGIGKDVWKHTHIWASLLMAAAGILHVILNWSVYCGYLWQRASGLSRKWELALALVVTVAVVATAALDRHDGMMQKLMAMNLPQIAEMSNQSVDQLVASLKKEGIEIHDPADSLREIAEHNKVPPQRIAMILQLGPPSRGHGKGPR
jgi:hypothetical protein